MFFDPGVPDSNVAGGAGASWKQTRIAVARRRPATDLLTLPQFDPAIPSQVKLQWRSSPAETELVRKHFQYGPLRAADVHNPTNAVDAFRQALFAWFRRQTKPFGRLQFEPRLFDRNDVRDVLREIDVEWDDDDTTPLFMTIELPNEWVYSLEGKAQALREAHPGLLAAVTSAIDWAGARTLWVRCPDWFMYEFACAWWDGDESISDEDADEFLRDAFDDDADARHHYLPSTVRPLICPEDVRPSFYRGGRWHHNHLPLKQLAALRNRSRGYVRRACTEVLKLHALLNQRRRKHDLFDVAYSANPAYAACSVVWDPDEFVGELLDRHYDCCANSGDSTVYSGFSRLAGTAQAIRQQYSDLSLAFQILRHLDRLLTLVTEIAN